MPPCPPPRASAGSYVLRMLTFRRFRAILDGMEIQRIRRLCSDGNIKWSVHAAEKMHERGIKRADVIRCLEGGEIIEDYPDDFPHPSCLVFGRTTANDVLHTVVGISGDTLFIITAYFPDTERFESDLRTRRQKNG